MNLLLDANVLLWWLDDNRRLTKQARSTIAEAESVSVSAATIWEVGIKLALGKLEVKGDLEKHLQINGFRELSVTVRHGIAAATLPRHHNDPFDRMLVAQATLEGLTLVTSDERLQAYRVPLLLV